MNAAGKEDHRQMVRQAESCLLKGESVEGCLDVLQDLKQRLLPVDGFRVEICQVYTQFLDFLLNQLSSKWYLALTDPQESELFDAFYLRGFPEETYFVLMKIFNDTSPSYKLDKVLNLMKNFLMSSAINEMFLGQCVCEDNGDATKQELRCEVWDELVSYLISLPERIANKLKSQKVQDIFRSSVYFCKIVDVLLWCLEQLRSRIDKSVDCTLQFLSRVLGRSCLSGHADVVMPPLIKFLSFKTSDDFVWRRVAQKLFVGIPDSCLEIVITYLFRKTSWYKIVSRLIGNAVMDNPKLSYLLTHKLLLVRCFEENLVLQNILGYLSDAEQRRPIFIKAFLNLLDVWGNKSNLKHRPHRQHLYITKAILVSLSYLNDCEKSQNREVVLPKLMHAMNSHLSSPLPEIRKLGMVTAKCITSAVNPDGPQLGFEYERDREVEELEALLILPSDPKIDHLSECIKTTVISENMTEKTGRESGRSDSVDSMRSAASKELDSDDDLEPYDMSNDTVVRKYDKPRYLRDCIEGLLEQTDRDRMEVSLEAAEPLIRSDPIGREEVAMEMAKILLHLDDRFCTKNFVSLRFGALTAITVTSPKLVAEYLGQQFYDRNYNMRQRMDILEVLVAAAQELSKPTSKASTESSVARRTVLAASPLPTMENWQDIVQKRIESKTRRFAKGRLHPAPPLVPNRFAAVAGHFFFPLVPLHGRQENTFDVLSSDYFILGRLVYSLGMIVQAAVNAPIVLQMGQTLLEFLWVLRYHIEPYVRRALIFSLSMVVLSVPYHYVIGFLQDSIVNWKDWLKDVVCNDVDGDCIQLAGQAFSLIGNTVKEGIPAAFGNDAPQKINAISNYPSVFE